MREMATSSRTHHSLPLPPSTHLLSALLLAVLRHRHARGTVASAVVEAVASSHPSSIASARMPPYHPCSSMTASTLSTSPSSRNNTASFLFLSSPLPFFSSCCFCFYTRGACSPSSLHIAHACISRRHAEEPVAEANNDVDGMMMMMRDSTVYSCQHICTHVDTRISLFVSSIMRTHASSRNHLHLHLHLPPSLSLCLSLSLSATRSL